MGLTSITGNFLLRPPVFDELCIVNTTALHCTSFSASRFVSVRLPCYDVGRVAVDVWRVMTPCKFAPRLGDLTDYLVRCARVSGRGWFAMRIPLKTSNQLFCRSSQFGGSLFLALAGTYDWIAPNNRCW